MATGKLFPAGLTALLVVVLVHQTCSANDNLHQCPPSSCGNIQNISYPFRLEDDPENCGDPRYNLSCENNQTVLYLYAGKYHVQEIDYKTYTIRVVDPGIQKDNYSFIPRYYLNSDNFSTGDPYTLDYPFIYGPCGSMYSDYFSKYTHLVLDQTHMVFVNCEKQVKSPLYLEISSCFNSSLSDSKRYTYVVADGIAAWDLEESCHIEQTSLATSWEPNRNYGFRYFQCTDFYDAIVSGFMLSWFQATCSKWRNYNGTCYFEDANHPVQCDNNTGLFRKIFELCTAVLGGVSNILVPWQMKDRLGIPYVQFNGNYTDFFRSLLLNILFFICGIHLAAKVVLGTPCVLAFLLYKWRRRHLSTYDVVEKFLQSHNNLMPIRYSFSEIKKISKNFKDKLGEGGYGTVFKGTLRSGRLVAIKMLGESKANGQDFTNEVATIGRIHHVNVVQLIGFCVEGSKRALIYEFMSNGSLNKHIFLPEVSTFLSYDKMYDIALGVARGIEYLHQGCDMQILHFDIKPHNILLDENFTPKVSDFGLAKLYPVNNSIISLTAARGTLGYMAPELFYKNIGGVSYKADVYSFGMLLMEMAGRRKNFNTYVEHSSQIYFPTWVYDQLRDGNDIEIEGATEEEKKIGKKMIIVALWCIQMKPNDRPSMNKVVQMLEGNVELLQMPSKPFLSSSSERNITDVGENSNESFESSQSSQF